MCRSGRYAQPSRVARSRPSLGWRRCPATCGGGLAATSHTTTAAIGPMPSWQRRGGRWSLQAMQQSRQGAVPRAKRRQETPPPQQPSQRGRSPTGACGGSPPRCRSASVRLPPGQRPPWQPAVLMGVAPRRLAVPAQRAALRRMCGTPSAWLWRNGVGQRRRLGGFCCKLLNALHMLARCPSLQTARRRSAGCLPPAPAAATVLSPPTRAAMSAGTAGCCRQAQRGGAAAAGPSCTRPRPLR
jgi:hypothetical protein